MRLIARLPETKQASFLVDSLRNGGFDRKDLIISDLAKEQVWNSPEQAADEVAFTKTEREGLWEIGTYASGIKGLEGTKGILVAVEAPKHDAARIMTMMLDSGAIEIIQD